MWAPFTVSPPVLPQDRVRYEMTLTRFEMEVAMAKWAVSHLIFWKHASSPHLEDNLLAARRAVAIAYSLSLAGVAAVLLNNLAWGTLCLTAWASSLAYLVRVYRKCARVLREDEVRQVMES